MSVENIELARKGYDAWNRADVDWFLEHMTEDVEVKPLRGVGDFERVYRGHAGWKRFWEGWRDAWSRIEIRVELVQDMGDHGVLALLTFEGVGRSSGVEVSMTVSHWLTFQDGMLSGITVMTPEAAERRREARG
jgi:ketosteroid isomerase-like protein